MQLKLLTNENFSVNLYNRDFILAIRAFLILLHVVQGERETIISDYVCHSVGRKQFFSLPC